MYILIVEPKCLNTYIGFFGVIRVLSSIELSSLRHISLRKDVAGITVTLICGSHDMMVWLPWFYSHLSSDCELRMDQTARILSSSVFQVVHRPGAVHMGPGSSRSLSGGVRDTHGACSTLITPKIRQIPWYHLWVLASLFKVIRIWGRLFENRSQGGIY